MNRSLLLRNDELLLSIWLSLFAVLSKLLFDYVSFVLDIPEFTDAGLIWYADSDV